MSTGKQIHRTSPHILDEIISSSPPFYALIRRTPAHGGADLTDILVGDTLALNQLADLTSMPLSQSRAHPEHGVRLLLPFRQIRERGYECIDDGEALRALRITESTQISSSKLAHKLPEKKISLRNEHYSVSDKDYEEIARKIITDEIGGGAGANFVLSRFHLAIIDGFDNITALSLFRSLLIHETGAYWTFIVHIGDRIFVGASPERHVSLSRGIATMNPISGTYRYPESGPGLDSLHSFLTDSKEADELYMVVDEELKMMARICNNGGTIYGPTIKPMARLAHTEYHIKGECILPPDQILKETLFAPTITGSPIENACRVIKKYEPKGRAYYSGVLALIGRDSDGSHALDSTILIRTADINSKGYLRIGVGSTLVRKSNPASEATETKAKASGLLQALKSSGVDPTSDSQRSVSEVIARFSEFQQDSGIRNALTARNSDLSRFWLRDSRSRTLNQFDLAGLNVLIIDAEDAFTSMIQHQLCSPGLRVVVRYYDDPFDLDQFNLVVVGPDPGDPQDIDDPRIASLNKVIESLLIERRPFLTVCLSHQILCRKLGLDLVRRAQPNQGTRREIDLFGIQESVGFYNSFNAVCAVDQINVTGGYSVDVSRDRQTNEVFALRSDFFASFQFHAESVLTKNGDQIFASYLSRFIRANGSLTRQNIFMNSTDNRMDIYDEHCR